MPSCLSSCTWHVWVHEAVRHHAAEWSSIKHLCHTYMLTALQLMPGGLQRCSSISNHILLYS